MNPVVKEIWIEALRSGRYEQTRGYLRTNAGYCCLGVLCEEGRKRGIVSIESHLSGYDQGTYYLYGQSRAAYQLPKEIMDWADLTEDDPRFFLSVDEQGEIFSGEVDRVMFEPSLAGLNDDGVIFDRIADVIEKKL